MTIALSLGKDGKYTWKFDQNGKPQQYAGALQRGRRPADP